MEDPNPTAFCDGSEHPSNWYRHRVGGRLAHSYRRRCVQWHTITMAWADVNVNGRERRFDGRSSHCRWLGGPMLVIGELSLLRYYND